MNMQHQAFSYCVNFQRRSLLNKMATSNFSMLSKRRPVIGVCQLTCTDDKVENFLKSKALIERCKQMGAEMVFLPEACDYIAQNKDQSMAMAETLEGETMSKYRNLAKELSVWLSIGGFHQKSRDKDVKRLHNTHVIVDSSGAVSGTYSKAHLFDLDIPGKIRLCESDYTVPGDKIVAPVATPVGKVGLGICYDMRFPEMAVGLRNLGAEILTYPSAFTIPTGMAHWQVLLRNRAIESQCYVVAAAQTGKHNEKRSSYGHSMIVDPWGAVVAECSEGEGVCCAEIDLEYLNRIRGQMPVQSHRRHDLYGAINLSSTGGDIDSMSEYTFGLHKIGSGQVFYRTNLSYAFVNIKPVVRGHVLVASLRCVERLSDLDTAEISDLFNTVNVVSKVIEKHFKGTSLSIAVQDGSEAGQTVKHVHAHILPRHKGDFEKNDQVYDELEKHDKDLEAERAQGKLRTVEEMDTEARELRPYFR